jgi:hypothetical protein
MTVMTTLLSNCAWEKDNNKSENADISICFLFSILDILLSNYFTSCLALSNIIIEIVVTCQRVIIISNKGSNERARRPWLVCLIIFIISLTVYSPVLFMSQVKTEETRNVTTVRRDYYPGMTDFGKSKVGLFLKQLIALLRIGLVLVVLSIVNCIASVKYTAFYNRKLALKEIIRGLLFNFKNSSSH